MGKKTLIQLICDLYLKWLRYMSLQLSLAKDREKRTLARTHSNTKHCNIGYFKT